jgi:hypothetical protein
LQSCWIPERTELITSLSQGTKASSKEQWKLAAQITPPNEDSDLCDRLYPGAGAVVSWEPYHSPPWWQW